MRYAKQLVDRIIDSVFQRIDLEDDLKTYRKCSAFAVDVRILECDRNVVAGIGLGSIEPGNEEVPIVAESGDFTEVFLNDGFVVDRAFKDDGRFIVITRGSIFRICRVVRPFVGTYAQSARLDRAGVLAEEILTECEVHLLGVGVTVIRIGERHSYVIRPNGLTVALTAVCVLRAAEVGRIDGRRQSEQIGKDRVQILLGNCAAVTELEIEFAVCDANEFVVPVIDQFDRRVDLDNGLGADSVDPAVVKNLFEGDHYIVAGVSVGCFKPADAELVLRIVVKTGQFAEVSLDDVFVELSARKDYLVVGIDRGENLLSIGHSLGTFRVTDRCDFSAERTRYVGDPRIADSEIESDCGRFVRCVVRERYVKRRFEVIVVFRRYVTVPESSELRGIDRYGVAVVESEVGSEISVELGLGKFTGSSVHDVDSAIRAGDRAQNVVYLLEHRVKFEGDRSADNVEVRRFESDCHVVAGERFVSLDAAYIEGIRSFIGKAGERAEIRLYNSCVIRMPWKSDFAYAVKRGSSVSHHRRTVIGTHADRAVCSSAGSGRADVLDDRNCDLAGRFAAFAVRKLNIDVAFDGCAVRSGVELTLEFGEIRRVDGRRVPEQTNENVVEV